MLIIYEFSLIRNFLQSRCYRITCMACISCDFLSLVSKSSMQNSEFLHTRFDFSPSASDLKFISSLLEKLNWRHKKVC